MKFAALALSAALGGCALPPPCETEAECSRRAAYHEAIRQSVQRSTEDNQQILQNTGDQLQRIHENQRQRAREQEQRNVTCNSVPNGMGGYRTQCF